MHDKSFGLYGYFFRECNREIIFDGTNTARSVHSEVFIHVLILVSYVRQTRGDYGGRILNIVLELDGHILNIINIYAPLTDSARLPLWPRYIYL